MVELRPLGCFHVFTLGSCVIVHAAKEERQVTTPGVSADSTTYITCPADPKKTLGIKLPFLVMIIKNLKKYFTFEVQVSVLESQAVRMRVNLWCVLFPASATAQCSSLS